jgi:hypothetical protein
VLATTPDWFTETVMLMLVVKLPEGEMFSQLTPVQLCSDMLAVKGVALAAVTASTCDAGSPPLAVALNVIAVVLSVRLLLDPPPPLTVRVTPTVCGLPVHSVGSNYDRANICVGS